MTIEFVKDESGCVLQCVDCGSQTPVVALTFTHLRDFDYPGDPLIDVELCKTCYARLGQAIAASLRFDNPETDPQGIPSPETENALLAHPTVRSAV